MKKILFIHPDLRGGGAEKVLVNMLNCLDPNKYEVSLTTIFKEGVNRELLSKNIKHKTIFNKVFRGWSIIQKMFLPSFLFKTIVKEDYDLIVAYLEGVTTRIVGGCNSPSTKLVSWIHVDITNFNIDKTFRSKKEMQLIYNRFDAIVGVSKTALNSLSKIISIDSAKTRVIYNVLDINHIIERSEEKIDDVIFSKDTINICTVGRLAKQKGYQRLLKTVFLLASKSYKFHLYIIGAGELENELKSIIAKNKIEEHVTLLGFKDNPHKYVKQCDFFVCSSFEEGYSTAVTESVIIGTPVLTTDCAGMDEILDNGKYGMIVENNENDLYNGLKEFIGNKDLLDKYKALTNERSLVLKNQNNIYEVESFFDEILN